MYPWLWFWAPQIHLPWSGAVSQNIEPRAAWFAQHIPADAGNASIEAQVTELASIDSIKAWEYDNTAQRVVKDLQDLQHRGGREFQEVAKILRPLLSAKKSG